MSRNSDGGVPERRNIIIKEKSIKWLGVSGKPKQVNYLVGGGTAVTKYHKLGSLNRNLLSCTLEVRGLRLRYWESWFLLRAVRENLSMPLNSSGLLTIFGVSWLVEASL